MLEHMAHQVEIWAHRAKPVQEESLVELGGEFRAAGPDCSVCRAPAAAKPIRAATVRRPDASSPTSPLDSRHSEARLRNNKTSLVVM